MAVTTKLPQYIKPFGIPKADGQPIPFPTPFRVYVSQSSPSVKIIISAYSAVFKSPNPLDTLDLAGIDVPIDIKYGDKIWLEIFYNQNLSPVLGIVNTDSKWLATTIGANKSQVVVYPQQLEFISSADIPNKISDLTDTTNSINTFEQATKDQITLELDMGLLDDTTATANIAQVDSDFSDLKKTFQTYVSNFNTFFSQSPTINSKKLFRTYSLIAYTTKNVDDSKLDGEIVSPPAETPTDNQGVPQSVDDPSFKIVQCLSNDLLLTDICYNNQFPAKLPMPYTRAVYDYQVDGQDEETTNTKDV